MSRTQIIIADSQQLIRIGLKAIFERMPDIEVVAEAENPKDLLASVKKLKPQQVIIDYTSAGFSIDVVPQLLQMQSDLKVIAITPEQSGITLVNAIKSGITSYIKKDCEVDEIVDSVKETAAGGKFFCGKILETIRKESIQLDNIDNVDFSCAPSILSARELEIIGLIAEGYTNDQISDKLFLSKHTVATHRKNIMAKLGVNNTAAIVMYAVKTHLVSPNKFLFSTDIQA
ncbi:MAG TPA: response regulator transcription factor [Luteibaculaceae bacterium]|jgi:DNA-binding NarL/FixJ family response regulator|nr:response regulator transcription factor [Luteibaculaceae bacterium]